MSLKKIKLVTFDATNTLLKFRVPPWEHYAAVAQNYGFRGSADDLKRRLLDSYKVMWNKYPNFGRDKINWQQWWRQVVKSTFEGHLPAPTNINSLADQLIEEFTTTRCWCRAEGGDKVISLIRQQGISLGVISNFDPRLDNVLQNVNIYNNFDFILTSYEIGFSKPDNRIFDCALKKCTKFVKPTEALHIGDDVQKDYEGAKAAGWHALLIAKNLKTEKPPASDHVFSSLKDLSIAIETNQLKL